MYAQTNIQLYQQLRSDGHSSSELAVVAAAYRSASRLYAGRFLASGRVFIAHVVGVAGILGTLRLPIGVVAAGLVHNAYGTGDFGPGRSGTSDRPRRFLRQAVGEDVESYVFGFRNHPWTRRAIEGALADPGRLNSMERMVLLMRLADVLEHHRDLDLLHGGDAEARRERIRRDGSLRTELARTLGFPELASELDRVFEETLSSELPRELIRGDSPSAGFVLAPRSYRRRWSVRRALASVIEARDRSRS